MEEYRLRIATQEMAIFYKRNTRYDILNNVIVKKRNKYIPMVEFNIADVYIDTKMIQLLKDVLQETNEDIQKYSKFLDERIKKWN